ncbi:ATP-binding protein [Chloroflexus sp.]|uniref:ATP-binding protein n=1 Tax=Chloroflexus sp. TaxID=1904827 RepID=UPI002ACE85FE|nr:ATP-binding protein [Chloroflexus sp.]
MNHSISPAIMRSNIEKLQTIIRRLLPLPALGLSWALTQFDLPPPVLWVLIGYAVVNIGLLFWIRRISLLTGRLLLVAGISDTIALGWCIATAGLTPALAFIQGISALRAWRYRFSSLWLALIPGLVGLVFALDLPLLALPDSSMFSNLAAFGSFLISAVTIATLILFGNQRNLATREWRTRYENLRREQKQQVASLEASNNDLRDRLRRMEALGESLRAISSSLSLDDVLRQILDSLAYMLGVQRIDDAALTLIQLTDLEHRILHADRHAPDWAAILAQAVITSQRTILLDHHEIEQRPEWAVLARYGFRAALSVPLFDPEQPSQVRGGLSVVSHQEEAFSLAEERHLTSFSIQAMIAIRNAELHVQLSRQQAMLSTVLHDMADGLIVYDDQGSVYLDNTIARRDLAQSAANNGTLATQLANIASYLHQAGDSLVREVHDGEGDEARYYQIHGTLVSPSPDTRLAVLVLHDVTGQKAQEQQRREFIAKVSHELRNPLNTLQGYLKIVLKESDSVGKLSERQREFLQEVDRSARRLAKRIVELIDLNRSETGQLKLNLVRTNVIDLIIATCMQQQQQVKELDIELGWDVPDQLPDVMADEERISQVLVNLIENAAKATSAGGKITVSAELQQPYIHIHVTDTGIGIPPEQFDKVFRSFYSGGNGSSRGPHLGLGLAICKQFVEAHGGNIWIAYSEVGKGTRFSFSLPLQHERTFGANTGDRAIAQ